MLHGRAEEVAGIHRLLAEARAGHSAMVVVPRCHPTALFGAATPTVGAGMSRAGRRVLEAFGTRVDRLPSSTRRALLVAPPRTSAISA